jgi:hypothetical protein
MRKGMRKAIRIISLIGSIGSIFGLITLIVRFFSQIKGFLLQREVTYFVFIFVCLVLVGVIIVMGLSLLKVKKRSLEIEKGLKELQKLGDLDKEAKKVGFEEIYNECVEDYFRVLDYIANQPKGEIAGPKLKNYYRRFDKNNADFNTMINDLVKRKLISGTPVWFLKELMEGWKITSKGLDFRKYYKKQQKVDKINLSKGPKSK